ncbi:MAG: DMT family transporter [Gammaproteobacteria bacterium]|uniref:DMT family transporter n=1 Tax=Halomonas sp. BN3-1 TaxID=2082393 RepID=UPI000D334CEE|nr:DMT family transporter [Halomonas sp. BN3-1]MBR9881012.1 DMT family transporter [Gammaproteobacteria bacterium]
MGYLVVVTALWAFSFSLIGVYLAGQVDSYFAVMMRVGLAALVFLPLLKPGLLDLRHKLALMALGAVQLGIMYIFFYQSFVLLSVPEVLLFTIFTPLYIAILDDLAFGRFTPFHLVTAGLAVIGAAVIRYKGVNDDFWLGFLVVQGANLCFAMGQVGYRRLSAALPPSLPRHHVFAWFYLGAACIALPAFALLGSTSGLPTTPLQWGVLLWLGLVASGLGYFLWNLGAVLVDAGALAIMNNMLIPAGLAVNLVIWNREADLVRLAMGGAIIAGSLWLNAWWQRHHRTAPV